MIIKRTHESVKRLGRGLTSLSVCVCVSAPKLTSNWTIEMNSLFYEFAYTTKPKNYSTKWIFYSLEGKSGLCVMMTSRKWRLLHLSPCVAHLKLSLLRISIYHFLFVYDSVDDEVYAAICIEKSFSNRLMFIWRRWSVWRVTSWRAAFADVRHFVILHVDAPLFASFLIQVVDRTNVASRFVILSPSWAFYDVWWHQFFLSTSLCCFYCSHSGDVRWHSAT